MIVHAHFRVSADALPSSIAILAVKMKNVDSKKIASARNIAVQIKVHVGWSFSGGVQSCLLH